MLSDIVTCFIGGVLAGKAAKVKRFLWGFFSGTAYFLVLLAVSFLIHKSIGSNMNELALIFAMCAGSGTIGGMYKLIGIFIFLRTVATDMQTARLQ